MYAARYAPKLPVLDVKACNSAQRCSSAALSSPHTDLSRYTAFAFRPLPIAKAAAKLLHRCTQARARRKNSANMRTRSAGVEASIISEPTWRGCGVRW